MKNIKISASSLFPRSSLTSWALLICAVYWMYLIILAQPIIVYDAIGYEQFGRLLADKGLGAYLRGGPAREPLYPLFISVAMKLSDWAHLPFLSVQKILQCAVLLMTQLMMISILRRLKVHVGIIIGTVLYFGLSPAVVNSEKGRNKGQSR